MKICAVVCEFNPFHNGHEYLLSTLKRRGVSHIVAIMSGNFVQRGDVAIVSKFVRAKMALLHGADVVVELPVRFSLSPAEIFAKAAIFLTKSMGCINCLGFGAECDDVKILVDIAQKLNFLKTDHLKMFLKNGENFPSARQKVLELGNVFGKLDEILKPNNILAIEYINALNFFNFDVKLELVHRKFSQHNSEVAQKSFASSTFIRRKISENLDVSGYIPQKSYDLLVKSTKNFTNFATLENGERAILGQLRRLDANELKHMQDVSEGLENWLHKAIKKSKNLEELHSFLQTKRYTLARMRRLVMSVFLGLQQVAQKDMPPYIRVLGFNEKGKDVLKLMKKTASLPIVTKYSEVLRQNDENIKTCFEMEAMTSDLYSLFFPEMTSCGQEMLNGPVILNK